MNTYNGWTNYQTWCVKVWIDNDEGLHFYWLDRANYHADDKTSQGLADELRQAYEGSVADFVPASVFSDLLLHSLELVNWHELADAMLEDVRDVA